jgi:hypothetical protein
MRFQGYRVLRLFFVLTMGCLGFHSADGQTTNNPIVLPASVRKMVFPADLAMARSQVTLPIVTNGYLLSFPHWASRQTDPGKGIFLTALADPARQRIPFWISGASSIHLDDGTVTPKGYVLIAGSYLQSQDSTDVQKFSDNPSTPEVINFIAELSPGGNLDSLYDLQEFTPERVCSTADGSIWVLGQDWPLEQQRKYFMLRHYSATGAFIEGYLPQIGKLDSPNYRRIKGTSRHAAFLTCGDDSVGVYLQRSGGFLWSEVELSSGKVAIRKVTILPNSAPTGVALFGEGVVYASFRSMTKEQEAVHFGPPLGIYKLDISQPQASWQPVGSTAESKIYSTLLGRDGPYLIHLEHAAGPMSDPNVYWTEVPK